MRAKYGIQDCDFYNFDETDFIMGVISSALVVTRADRRGRGTDFKTYRFQQHPFGQLFEASPSTTNTLVIIPTGGEYPQ
jgi:hypothetical protein